MMVVDVEKHKIALVQITIQPTIETRHLTQTNLSRLREMYVIVIRMGAYMSMCMIVDEFLL